MNAQAQLQMNPARRLILMLAVLVLALGLASCGSYDQAASDDVATASDSPSPSELDPGVDPSEIPDEPACHEEYEDACLDPDAVDLDCDEISEQDFDSVGSDPFDLDRDTDGTACESDNATGEPSTEPDYDYSQPDYSEPDPDYSEAGPDYSSPPPDHSEPEYPVPATPSSGDLDCSDIGATDIPVPPGDPNGLDRDGDGIGCES